MKCPKPQHKCKECGKFLKVDDSVRAYSGPVGFCNFKCKAKRAKIRPNRKKALKTNNIPYKSTIKRLDIQLNNTRFKPTIKLDREKYDRDEDYLAFVRSFPCMICGNKSTTHHTFVPGIGLKCSDFQTINLCAFHHTMGGASVHHLGTEEFEKVHNVNIKDQQIELLKEYIRRLKNNE